MNVFQVIMQINRERNRKNIRNLFSFKTVRTQALGHTRCIIDNHPTKTVRARGKCTTYIHDGSRDVMIIIGSVLAKSIRVLIVRMLKELRVSVNRV